MSTMLNRYERNLKDRLQTEMSSREADWAIQDIRESLYGDCYEMLHPMLIVNSEGKTEEIMPSVTEIIEAYHNGDYSKFK